MATRTWQGPNGAAGPITSGNWNTGTNWSGGAGSGPPNQNDDVIIPVGGANGAYSIFYDVTTATTYRSVTLNGGTSAATLVLGAHTFSVLATGGGATDLLSIGSGATVTVAGGTINAGGVTVTGTLSGAGTVNISASGSTTHTINGSGAITANGGLLELNGQLASTAALTIVGAGDTLKLDGAASTANSVNFNGASGTLELNTAATLTVSSAMTVGAGTVKLDAAGGAVQLTDNSGLTLAGGSITGTGSVAANTNISGSGTVAISISNAGTITANGGTLDLTGTVSGRTLAIATTAGSDLKIDGTTTTSAAIAIGNANQTLEVGAHGNLTITGAHSVSGGGTIKLDGGTLGGGTLTVGSGGNLTGSGTVNDAISGNGGTITASNGVLNLTSTVASGQSFAIDPASASTLLFSGTTTTTTSGAISITSNNQKLEIGPNAALTINSAESFTNGTIQLDGGTLGNASGNQELAFTVGSGGTLTGWGNAPNDITLAGGTVTQSGGTLTTTSITGHGTVNGVTGAFEIAAAGGTLDLTGAVSGALLAVDPNIGGVLKVDGNVTAGDTGWIQLTSANQTVDIGATGTLALSFSETVSNGTIKLDGGTLNANGGLVGSLAKTNGVPGIGVTLIGEGIVNGGAISGSGVVEGEGGTLTINDNVTSSSILLEADSSSVLALDGTVASGITFDYLNTNGFSGGLMLDTGARSSFEAGGTIVGMHVGTSATVATDYIDLAGVAPSSFTKGIIVGSTIELLNGTNQVVDHFTLSAAPGPNTFVDWQADGTGTDVFLSDVVCYAAGTRILTVTGERAVESLMAGDIVLTLAGGELVAQPVRWIGRRRIDLTAHPEPETVAPVRIARSAFAEAMPHRDLLLSPDHAVFVDGKLICVRQLINGSTIRAEKGWTAVEYYHVELDAHAVLLAEGLPAESYLDTGNRGFFANGGEPLVLHPDLTDESDYPARAAGSCAPFVTDEAGVLPVWQRLAERAAMLGQPAPKVATTADPALRLVAKGRTLRPLYGENGLYIFALPKGATEVRLLSRSAAPTDARPWLDDRRCLGVSVERIVLRGASDLLEVPVDHRGLVQGWHAVERDGVALRRWTDGEAVLPLPRMPAPTMLEIRATAGGMIYLADAEQTQRAA